MSLTTPQKEKLRADGHKSKFYLSVAGPVVVLTCLVNNGSIKRGATAIAVDGGTAADLSAVKAGMTLAVTTATGVQRVRIAAVSLTGSSPTITGTISVDTNAIVWGDNQAITVYSMFEPWAIMPTFNAATGVSKKRGATFSNQTRQPGPIAQAGPHRPGFVENGTLAFSLSATNMVMTPGASISSHAWETTIGSLSASNVANPTLTIDTPGEGWLYYTSTDSNGKTHTAIRHVWAHDLDPDSSDYPYTDFEVSGLSLSFNGGYRASIKVTGVADFNQFLDGALVCLWKETWYGATKTHISLNTEAEGQLFVGYIVKDSIVTDAEHGSVTFEVQSLTDISKTLAMQALSIHAEALVQYWFQMPTWMTMKHMLHWLLHWHSNLLELADWDITTNTKKKKLFTFNDGSLGSQAMDAASKLVAQIGCNKAGQMFVEEDVNFLSTSARAAMDTVMDITRTDWRGERTIVRRPFPQTSYVELKGYSFDGTTITPHCSVAPTRIRGNRGSRKSVDGMIVSNQADADFLAGRFYATDNNPIEEVRVSFAGDYSVLDVFPQRWYTTTVASDDTLRGVTYTDIRMVPRTVSLQLDTKNGVCLVDAVFEAEAFGPDGIAVTCPNSGETPAADPPWPASPATASGGTLTALAAGQSVDYRDSNASDWTEWNDTPISHLAVDRYWKTKAGSVAPDQAIVWTGSGGAIRRETRTEVSDRTPAEDPPDSWSDDPAPGVEFLSFVQVWSDPFVQSRLYALATWSNENFFYRAWLLRSEDEGASWEYIDLWDTSAPDKLTALWLAGNATHLLVVTWEERSATGKLWLRRYDISDGSFVEATEIQECTYEELNDSTYLAYPVTVLDNDDLWYLAGRMGNPLGLAGGIYHIITSDDAGDTWTSYEAGWGTDLCSALYVDSPASGDRTHYAVRGPGNASFTPLALGPGSAVAVAEMTADRSIVYYVSLNALNPSENYGMVALLDTSVEPPEVLDLIQMPGSNLYRTYVSVSKIDDNFALLGARVYDTMGLHTITAEAAIIEITGALDDTLTFGTPAGEVDTDPTSVTVAALSTTKAVICWENNGAGKGAVLDLDTGTRAVTFNTPQTFQASGISWPSCCKVDATTALVVWVKNSDILLYGNALDAIGTSWTLGADALISAEADTTVFDSGSINGQYVAYLEDGAALVLYQAWVDTGVDFESIIRSRKLTVTGSSIAVGGANNVTLAGIGTYDWNPVVRGDGLGDAHGLYVRNDTLYRVKLSGLGIVQSTSFVHGNVSYGSIDSGIIAYSDQTPAPDQVNAVRFS